MTPQSFDGGYRRWRASAEHAALIGEGYPKTIEPFSFVPFDSLSDLAATLEIGPGQTLVDLGCGRGGIGMYVAGRLGSDLVGVDASSVAINDARERSRRTKAAEFIVADVAATGLAGGHADALISIDVLQLVADPTLVVREAERVLRPGGRLALTTWEGRVGAPSRFPRRIGDLLKQSGFDAIEVQNHPDWLERQLAIYESARASRASDEAVADLAGGGGPLATHPPTRASRIGDCTTSVVVRHTYNTPSPRGQRIIERTGDSRPKRRKRLSSRCIACPLGEEGAGHGARWPAARAWAHCSWSVQVSTSRHT